MIAIKLLEKLKIMTTNIKTTRFIKNLEVAELLTSKGFKITKHSKDLFECCQLCGESFATQEGFLIEANKKELLTLGIISSKS